ncbi:MAG: molybdate ABC transporter substrate-binding protein [Burkholderiaceae bacterium]|jgi:molybdate transport system substrate-binding protein|nr:molybdate ABC transporter substrate-binding protein [Burkholderiaceae bacterium]
MLTRARLWFAAALVALSAWPLHAQELVVSAAASLNNAFQALGADYERSHPGQKVIFNFAASGVLLAQIRQGAPVDVLACADEATMDRAVSAGLIAEGTRAVFARNVLVVAVPAARAAAPPADLRALAGSAFKRIATGTPATVPAGHYTAQALQQAGLSAALAPKWIFGESVRQVLNYIARGEVDAGFVYRTDALLAPEQTRIAFTVPMTDTVRYPMALTAASRQQKVAQAFIAHVRSPQGQAVLRRFGFEAP